MGLLSYTTIEPHTHTYNRHLGSTEYGICQHVLLHNKPPAPKGKWNGSGKKWQMEKEKSSPSWKSSKIFRRKKNIPLLSNSTLPYNSTTSCWFRQTITSLIQDKTAPIWWRKHNSSRKNWRGLLEWQQMKQHCWMAQTLEGRSIQLWLQLNDGR